MSNFNNIFDNKTQYEKRFSVDLTIKSGYTIDYGDWVDRSISTNFDIPWDLLDLTVIVDDCVLYQGTVGINGIQLHHTMLDSDKNQQHSITISVAGFTSAHSFSHNDQEINAQLLISEFKIEHLDLLPLVSKEGIKIFNEPSESNPCSHELLRGNHSQILNFNTPIYPWLLSKFSDINHY